MSANEKLLHLLRCSNEPLPYQVFAENFDISEEDFLLYLRLMDDLRAAVISANNFQLPKQPKKGNRLGSPYAIQDQILSLAIDNLFAWFYSKLDVTLELKFNLGRKLMNCDHCMYQSPFSRFSSLALGYTEGYGLCPLVYLSPTDFRSLVEKYLVNVLIGDEMKLRFEGGLCCSLTEAKKRLALVESELFKVQKAEPANPKSLDNYQALCLWAHGKSDYLLRIEQLEDNISELESYIDELENSTDFHLTSNILWVHRGTIKCIRDKHPIESVTAQIKNKSGHTISINVNRCEQCGEFFISYDEYLYYKDLYGAMICSIRMTHDGEFLSDQVARAEDSPLSLSGYNVNQIDDYTDAERQTILTQILRGHIMDKSEIIKYLNVFIRVNGAKSNMRQAVERWRSDLEFVRNFDMPKQNIYTLNDIREYRGYKDL